MTVADILRKLTSRKMGLGVAALTLAFTAADRWEVQVALIAVAGLAVVAEAAVDMARMWWEAPAIETGDK